MNDNLWNNEELDLLKTWYGTVSNDELENTFLLEGYIRSANAIRKKANKIGLSFEFTKTQEQEQECTPEQKEAWLKILGLKNEYMEDFTYSVIGIIPSSKIARKILCISDFHIPFDREDLIMEIISQHQDADILVINGDIMDLHAVSTWPKERDVVLKKEYDIAMEYMKVFSKKFPQVVVTRGNHEVRLSRYFNSCISNSVSFLVNKDILNRLCSGEVYNNNGEIIQIYDFSNVYYKGGLEGWFEKIGKTIFAHPKEFSKVEAKTVMLGNAYFMEREDIDCIVIGHTHNQAFVPSRKKLCIESGCLCCPMDYEKQGTFKYHAMTLGYTIIYQDYEGNCDFNRSRNVYLGTQYPITKNFLDIEE